MPLAIDASTPTWFNASSTTASTATTPSFVPPLGALLIVLAAAPNVGTIQKPSNTGGAVTWDAAAKASITFGNTSSSIWGGIVTTSASMTVTQTLAATEPSWGFGVVVITGQYSSPYGAFNTGDSASALPSLAVTTQGANSLILGVIGCNSTSTLPTIPAGQSDVFNSNTFSGNDTSNVKAAWAQYLTGINLSQGATATLNDTAPSCAYSFAMLEVLEIPAPIVTSVAPDVGATAGGTNVIIVGQYFTGATAVQFGGTNATSYTVIDDWHISAVAPSGSLGVVNVTVTNGSGTSPTGAQDDFTYLTLGSVPGIGSTYLGQSPPAVEPYIASGPAALTVNVSDSTTTAEAVTVAEGVLTLSVSDSTTTGQTLGELLVSFVSVSDSTTTGEILGELETSFVNVADSTTTGEQITAQMSNLQVSVSDSTTTGEIVGVSSPLSIVVTQTNLYLNPSFEYGIASFTAANGTVAQSAAQAFSGTYSALVTSNGAGTIQFSRNVGFPYDGNVITAGVAYAFSAYVLAASTSQTFHINLTWYNSAHTQIGTQVNGTGVADNSAGWTQIALLATAPAAAVAYKLVVTNNATPANGEQHYIDAIQVTQSAQLLSYFDGDKAGCFWNGTPGAATSTEPFETVTTAESVSASLLSFASASDATSTTETIAASLSDLQVSVSDSTATAESVTVAEAGLTPFAVNVSDSTSTGETLEELLVSFVGVSDATATAESVTVSLPGIGALTINVTDATATTETLGELLTSFVGVSDSTATAESITAAEADLALSVSDATSTGEIRGELLLSFVNVSDATATAETVAAQSPGPISVSDAVSTGDSVNVVLPAAGVDTITVSDATSTTETVAAQVSAPQITVADATATADTPTVALQPATPRSINVTDSTTTAESVSASSSTLQVGASDATVTAESVTAQASNLQIAVSDSTATGEQVSVSFVTILSHVTVSDATSVGELVNVTLPNPLQASVSDSTLVGDSPRIFIGILPLEIWASAGDTLVQRSFALDQAVVSSAGGNTAQISMALDVPVVWASGGDALLQKSLGGDVA